MKTSEIVTFSLPIETKKAAKCFTSWCPALEICSYGETKEIAEEYLKKIIEIFLIYCYEQGALERVIKDCGLTTSKRSLSNKSISPFHEIDVTLPSIITR